MRVVGIRIDNNSEFESQSYDAEEQIPVIQEAIRSDANAAGIEIRIELQ